MKICIWAHVLWLATSVMSTAVAAPGEYWEMTSKMEMTGMPFSMPATTTKVCMPKGNESDPRYVADKECQVTDIKVSGNKTSWKVRCDRKGDVLNGSGEMSVTPDRSEGTIRMNGVSGGQKIDMTQTYSNKRIGGSCDSEEQMNKVKNQLCDTKGFEAAQWISNAHLFLEGNTCPGKKDLLCASVRKEAPSDAGTYLMLLSNEKANGGLIARSCGLNMDATTKAICRTVSADNVNALTPYCPAEVKAFRENARRRACEGRSYTGKEDLSTCLAGDDGGSSTSAESKTKNKAIGNSAAPASPVPANPAAAVIDGAQKLKSLFGF